MPPGVPTFKKFSAIKRAEYIKLLAEGNHKCTSAVAVGVSASLVCLYRQAFPEFALEEEAAQMQANAAVVNALWKAATSGNVTAIQVWLYNRMSSEWTDRRNPREPETIRHEHSGPNGAPLQIDRPKLTDDEQKAELRKLIDRFGFSFTNDPGHGGAERNGTHGTG